jgi:hypothetical protein
MSRRLTPAMVRKLEDKLRQKISTAQVLQYRINTYKVERAVRAMDAEQYEKMMGKATTKQRLIWDQIRTQTETEWERDWKIRDVETENIRIQGEINMIKHNLESLLT